MQNFTNECHSYRIHSNLIVRLRTHNLHPIPLLLCHTFRQLLLPCRGSGEGRGRGGRQGHQSLTYDIIMILPLPPSLPPFLPLSLPPSSPKILTRPVLFQDLLSPGVMNVDVTNNTCQGKRQIEVKGQSSKGQILLVSEYTHLIVIRGAGSAYKYLNKRATITACTYICTEVIQMALVSRSQALTHGDRESGHRQSMVWSTRLNCLPMYNLFRQPQKYWGS